ncbi:MAG TPA: magnesium/cobalt transporter CorA [Methylomirabilota bacterium]|jgi:magnesium transporter|nr:magnesium/cobalt transporter CorA [Methylomirabilota bacterium]
MDFRRRQQHLRAALGLRRPRISRIRPGAPPGTLVVSESAQPPVIEVRTFGHEGIDEQRVATIDAALGRLAPGTVTWINIDGLGDSGVLSRLGERLGLHPLALEDVLNVPQRPKVERFDKHMFVVMRTMRLERPQGVDAASVTPTIVDEQVSLFFGADWVVTIQERSDGDCFEAVREALRHGRGRARDAGADYLAYLLADAVIDAYFPVLDELAERMHALEEEALAPMSSEGTLSRLTRLRHDLMTVRRAVWPMREVATVLQREETSLVTAETRVFLRDAYDHAVQALEIVESLRETAVSVMEVFLSVQNQRLNEVMKVLTVIATIFIPLTFIASIYGMNFKHMPELEARWGYPAVLGVMLLTAGGMIAYFRRRGWW